MHRSGLYGVVALLCTINLAIAQSPACRIMVSRGEEVHRLDIVVSVDGQRLADFWDQALQDIFNFADADADGKLSPYELKHVPSARAMRMVLGSGFTPPIAPIQSMQELVDNAEQFCDLAQLKAYYRRHHAASIQVALRTLSHSQRLAEALVSALDIDHDGQISPVELEGAGEVLSRLDGNDDELLAASELLPGASYPGSIACGTLHENQTLTIETAGRAAIRFQRFGEPLTEIATASVSKPTASQLSISLPTFSGSPTSYDRIGSTLVVAAWSKPGGLDAMIADWNENMFFGGPASRRNSEAVTSSTSEPAQIEPWYLAIVDRDNDGQASAAEKQAWLKLQRTLNQGQLLVSIYAGASLFEFLDGNHDGALSRRELRNAGQTLHSICSNMNSNIQLNALPDEVLVVASHGYLANLSVSASASIPWFDAMDRNRDGDISRREFNGSATAFANIDRDRDGLISIEEASDSK